MATTPNKTFDPVFIVYQIVSIQCFFYLIMGTLWGVVHAVFDTPVSLDHFFTAKYTNMTSISGWTEILCSLTSAVAGAYLLLAIVEKSKKCVDFTFTLYFNHIVLCTLYSRFPLDWEWWVVLVLSSVTMASLGEYWCSRNELEDIPLYSPERA